jgi:nitric oxide reductase large subunit
MKWYWKVRIYDNMSGNYAIGQLVTGRDTREIDHIMDFYRALTGGKMLLEGMSENKFEDIRSIEAAFTSLWIPFTVGKPSSLPAEWPYKPVEG